MAKVNTTTDKSPATPPKQLTAAELREQLRLINEQLAEANTRELQPKIDDIKTKFDAILVLVEDVQGMDENYVPPFMVRVEREELTEDTIKPFLGTDGKSIGDINGHFKGGSKKIGIKITKMIEDKIIVKSDVPKQNGRGTMTIYKKK